jgi:hypothetical protein
MEPEKSKLLTVLCLQDPACDPFLSQLNPAYNLTSYFLKIQFYTYYPSIHA